MNKIILLIIVFVLSSQFSVAYAKHNKSFVQVESLIHKYKKKGDLSVLKINGPKMSFMKLLSKDDEKEQMRGVHKVICVAYNDPKSEPIKLLNIEMSKILLRIEDLLLAAIKNEGDIIKLYGETNKKGDIFKRILIYSSEGIFIIKGRIPMENLLKNI